MAFEGSFKKNGHNVVVGDAGYFTSYAGSDCAFRGLRVGRGGGGYSEPRKKIPHPVLSPTPAYLCRVWGATFFLLQGKLSLVDSSWGEKEKHRL